METIDYSLSDGVAVVTLARPDARNAINPRMASELGDLLAGLNADPTLKALVLTGTGGNFCAGGDVRAMGGKGSLTAEERREGFKPFQRIATELLRFERPVIAAVEGVAYGAGMSLLLMADMVLVSENARLCMVFQRMGLVPDLAALYTLPRIVGLQRAKELVFSAREISAGEACALGLAMEAVPEGHALPRAMEIARSLAGGSSYAISVAKQALQSSLTMDLPAMLELEANAQAVAATSTYAQEAMRRFAAKEAAQFRWAARKD